MNLNTLVKQLANRINQPHHIESTLRQVFIAGVRVRNVQNKNLDDAKANLEHALKLLNKREFSELNKIAASACVESALNLIEDRFKELK